ncbi:MAG: hypothetical protein WD225_11140, partial [Ilumatobacteraceae bacterium]
LDEITVTGTLYLGGTEYHTETHTLDEANGWTKTIVGEPAPNDYTLEWEAIAGDHTDSGSLEFTVEDCDDAGSDNQEVLDVELSVDTEVCEEVTYVIDGTGSANLDEITVTGTLYLGGTEYHTETHTLDEANGWTKTIVGEPAPNDYTLEWEAIAGDHTDSGSLEFTVEDCDTVGDGDGGDEDDAVDKVEICHATAAPTNPYRLIEPAVEGVLDGHADQHTGPVFAAGMDNGEWGDIIPSFTYVDDNGDVQEFDGLNWDEQGQDVFDADCAVDGLAAAAPGLTVTKTADVDTVTFEDEDDSAEVTYTYTITNSGNVALELTVFDDDKIADIDLDDLEAVLDDGVLAAEGSVTVDYSATLTMADFDADGELTNVVTVTGLIEGANPDDTDNTVTDTADETVEAVEDDEGGETPPVEVEPDFIVDVPDGEIICIGTDTVLDIEVATDDDTVDFDDLELMLEADDLELTDYGFDADTVAFDAEGNVSVTLSDLPVGTHVIAYDISLDGQSVQDGEFTLTIIDCPPFPTPPGDGDDDDDGDGTPDVVGTVELSDVELICPTGDDPGFRFTTSGTDLDGTDGTLAVAYTGATSPFWTGDIELGDEIDIAWPVDLDGNDLDQFVIWVAFGDATSDAITLDVDDVNVICAEVLDEVIDAPDDDGETDGQAPDGTDDSVDGVDGDEAAREDDDEDEVLGAEGLPRTGVTVFGLLAAGLLSLLTGAGLLRRRS